MKSYIGRANVRRFPGRQSVRRLVEPGGTPGEDLAAVLGDADAVLELGGEAAVAGDGGPAVVEQFHRRLADVDHRLDGEEHAGAELGAGAGAAGMDDLGAVVEDAAEAVAAEIADDAVAIGLGVGLDGVADVAEMGAGPGGGDAADHAFVGHVDEAPRLYADVADQEHPAGVAVPAVEDDGDVDIDDVAVLQRPLAGDAVADDMVDRGAAAAREAAIAQSGGDAP